MSRDWVPVPIDAKHFQNLEETALTKSAAALENGFQNEAGGITRFPGLKVFANLPDNSKVYLESWRGDLMAVTGHGSTFRLDESANQENVTAVHVQGGKRVIFAKTPDELVMAAGAQIIRFAGVETEVLSEDAPTTTHVGYLDGFLIASDRYTGFFRYTDQNEYMSWPPLNVFAADSVPDNINGLIVTPFRELMLCGEESIEQFERLASADSPFFRRGSVGEGVSAPYTLCFADDAVWTVNHLYEFIRFSQQVSQPGSGDIGKSLEAIPAEQWSDAWTVPIHVLGQKFILLQIPRAINVYGTEGITLLLDYRQQKWLTLYGWDPERFVPNRWPGWSYKEIWGRRFIGGEGVIYELDLDNFNHAGEVQRFYGRTAHFSEMGEVRIDNLRMRLKRGTGNNLTSGTISVRGIRDNQTKTMWVRKKFGLAGDRFMYLEFGGFGCGHTHQFEWFVSDDCDVQVIKMDVQLTKIGS